MNIFIYDEFEPEAMAMMQALYSRSAKSVKVHADKVKSSGSKKFMESFYVGYGHASIGDCGVTTLFIEGVSILAAKALQDNALYSGQETSTRYIDFSEQEILNPLSLPASKDIQEKWIEFYTNSSTPVKEYLKKLFPLKDGESKQIWEKAITARSFDILRGFLPAGATTQLSWTTNLRQAYDKLSQLQHHPLDEIKIIAEQCLKQLKEKYPSSFSHRKDDAKEKYYDLLKKELHYSDYEDRQFDNETLNYTTNIDNLELEKNALEAISQRPKRTELPKFLERYGLYNTQFLLDYGSFRDLQRHRNGLCRIPILNNKHGFHPWYLNQLPQNIREKAELLLTEQFNAIDVLKNTSGVNDTTLQYYYPMGCNVLCELVYSLPEMVYVIELRSGSTVHPTLRKIAKKMCEVIALNHPKLKLYADMNQDTWDIKRGTQDIQKK